MKLIKIENEKEVWYFTSITRAAEYIGCTYNHVKQVIYGVCKKAKGWSIEIVEDDYVLSKFIDPEGPIEEEQVVLMKKLDEAIKILINNDKRINELEKRIENLNELTNKLKKEL